MRDHEFARQYLDLEQRMDRLDREINNAAVSTQRLALAHGGTDEARSAADQADREAEQRRQERARVIAADPALTAGSLFAGVEGGASERMRADLERKAAQTVRPDRPEHWDDLERQTREAVADNASVAIRARREAEQREMAAVYAARWAR